jgi:hypothetical protein
MRGRRISPNRSPSALPQAGGEASHNPLRAAFVESGGSGPREPITITIPGEGTPSQPRRATGGGGGARAHAYYQDRHEEYILVTKDDFREIQAFGWIQQALFGIGTFFFSGAFWLLMNY